MVGGKRQTNYVLLELRVRQLHSVAGIVLAAGLGLLAAGCGGCERGQGSNPWDVGARPGDTTPDVSVLEDVSDTAPLRDTGLADTVPSEPIDDTARTDTADAVDPPDCELVDRNGRVTQWGGGPLAGELDVRVVDRRTGTRLEDAVVMVGEGPDPAFLGRTDAKGRVVFEGPDLSGPIRLTAIDPDGEYLVSIARLDASTATVAVPHESTDVLDWPRTISGEISGLSQVESSREGTRFGIVTTPRRSRGCCYPSEERRGTFDSDPSPFEIQANTPPSLLVGFGGLTTGEPDSESSKIVDLEPTRMGIHRLDETDCGDAESVRLDLDRRLDQSVTIAFAETRQPVRDTNPWRVYPRLYWENAGYVRRTRMNRSADTPEVALDHLPNPAEIPGMTLTLDAKVRYAEGRGTSSVYLHEFDVSTDRRTVQPLPPTFLADQRNSDRDRPGLPRSGPIHYEGDDADSEYLRIQLWPRRSSRRAELIVPGDATSYRFPRVPDDALASSSGDDFYPHGSARVRMDRYRPRAFDYSEMRPIHHTRKGRVKSWYEVPQFVVPADF